MEPPEYLNELAKKEWERITRIIKITTVDRACLALYCQTYSRLVEMESELGIIPTSRRTRSETMENPEDRNI